MFVFTADILTVPEYEVDAVAHYGFPIFEEDKLLFKWTTASEKDKQNIGLLVAKVFAEFVRNQILDNIKTIITKIDEFFFLFSQI